LVVALFHPLFVRWKSGGDKLDTEYYWAYTKSSLRGKTEASIHDLVYISTCCLRECGSEQSAIGEMRTGGWKTHSAGFFMFIFLILKKSFQEKET